MATKSSAKNSQERSDSEPVRKRRNLSGMDAFGEMDSELKQLIEQDELRFTNEAKRLKLVERRLAVQEKQFERDAEERRAITDILRVLISNIKDAQ